MDWQKGDLILGGLEFLENTQGVLAILDIPEGITECFLEEEACSIPEEQNVCMCWCGIAGG